MLKILSYLNIAFAILYFLLYLLNSTAYAMAGIAVVIVFNSLVLRNIEQGKSFKLVHFIIGATNVFFAAFLVLWVTHVILSSIRYNYFANTWLYILITIPFVISIGLHFILVFLKYRQGVVH
ncbi:putative neutral ceramidase superfamily lipid hydrolase [Pedobacter sp. UYP24]